MAQSRLFYSLLGATSSLAAFYLTITVDRWLAPYTLFPYPLATGFLVVAIVVSFPVVSRWITTRLDGILFHNEHRQEELAYHLAEALAETPDPRQLQGELLGALCAMLNVHSGYLALPAPDMSPETLIVNLTQGAAPAQVGEQVRRPPLAAEQVQLASALLFQQEEDSWPGVALFCLLSGTQGEGGVLALGEKRNGKSFTSQDLALCTELARQLDAVSQMSRLRAQRNSYLEAARLHERELQQVAVDVTTATRQALVAWEDQAVLPVQAPLEIRLLGPLQVTRRGQTIPEAAWGSERAQALLAYLLWKGAAGASREELSAALWPDRSMEEAANVFHVTLHRLRRVLEPEGNRHSSYILHQRRRYRFNTEAPHWLDVRTFRRLVTAHASESLQAAVALYRGPYLADAGWVLPPEVEIERQTLEQLYVSTLRRLAAQVDSRTAGAYLEKLLAIEPADETAHRLLTLGYLARGRRDLARRQVARWRKVLAEMEMEPTAETRALWEKVEQNGGHSHQGRPVRNGGYL